MMAGWRRVKLIALSGASGKFERTFSAYGWFTEEHRPAKQGLAFACLRGRFHRYMPRPKFGAGRTSVQPRAPIRDDHLGAVGSAISAGSGSL
jgi:hypothetical protein